MMTATILGFAAFVVLALTSCQSSLIYFPRKYEPRFRATLPEGMLVLEFTTSQGRQIAFYQPPQADDPGRETIPERLWIYTGGNAALALDWEDVVLSHRNPRDGHLLVDYPGYGACEGRPSPATIDENVRGALGAILATHDYSEEELLGDIGTVGHSLGAAVALRTAVAHDARRVILISPFTSLRDMARRMVGWPLCLLLHHNFDNRAMLAELDGELPDGAVVIFHGALDDIVPVAMSRELAKDFPALVDYREIPKGDHNAILGVIHRDLLAAMEKRDELSVPKED